MLSWTFVALAAPLALLPPGVPPRLRSLVLAAFSLGGLALVWHVPIVPMLAALLAVFGVGRVLPSLGAGVRPAVLTLACAAVVAGLVALRPGGGVAASVVGVSYLALKLLQHLIDAGDGRTAAVGVVDYLCTMTFLPTWASGPIERTTELPRTLASEELPVVERVLGLERILVGLGKKLLLADPLLTWAQPVLHDPATAAPSAVLLAIYAFALGLYLDFGGYSDLAIGVARCAGVVVHENFDFPYLQRDIGLLWQHWHMTLTRWLRDFLFLPITRRVLRRTKNPLASQIVGHGVTMGLCGLWHGFGWHFLVWGLYNAAGLSGLAAWRAWRGPARARTPGTDALATLATFHFFAFGLVLFTCDLHQSVRVLLRLGHVL